MSALTAIGKSAMFASYAALQTAGNNIANANTPGYSRQQVQLSNLGGQFTGSGFFGKGVQVDTVTRAYDKLLTLQANITGSTAAADAMHLDKLSLLEGVFPIGASGLGSAAGDFLNAFVDVANNPTDASARQVVLSKAEELASRFRNAGDRLTILQSGVTQDMAAAVKAVNSKAQEVGRLNHEISALRAGGQPPNQLLDERDKVIAEIGKYIDVTSIEADDGSLGLFIGGGQNLVLGSVVNSLKVLPDPFDPAKAQIAVTTGSSDRLIPQEAFSGGSISGLLKFQNNDLTQAVQLLGQMATAVSGAVNVQQARGLDLSQPAGRGVPIFSVADGRVLTASDNTGNAQLSFSVTDASLVQASEYELTFDGSNYSVLRIPQQQAAIGSPFSPAALAAGVSIDGATLRLNAGTAQAGDRFLMQPASLAAQTMQVVLNSSRGIAAASPFTASLGVNNTGTASVGSVLAVTPSSASNVTADISFTSGTGNYAWTLFDGTSTTTGTGTWTAGNPITLGGFELKLDGVPRSGDTVRVVSTLLPAGNNGNAVAFAQMGQAAIVGNTVQASGPVLAGMNITDAYASALADIGVRVQGGKTADSISRVLASDAETSRANKAGVNLDEEAARLIQFQQSYQAAGKILQVAQTVFDALLRAAAG